MSEKLIDAVVVGDTVGYENADGEIEYAARGAKIKMSQKDWKRHGERDDAELNRGNFPLVVKADHPHLDFLKAGVASGDSPSTTYARLQAAHGGKGALLDPAGNPVDEASTTRAPTPAIVGLNVDWSKLSKPELEAVAEAAGIDTKGMKAAEIQAALQGASAGAGVTPRVGAAPAAESPETGAGGDES